MILLQEILRNGNCSVFTLEDDLARSVVGVDCDLRRRQIRSDLITSGKVHLDAEDTTQEVRQPHQYT